MTRRSVVLLALVLALTACAGAHRAVAVSAVRTAARPATRWVDTHGIEVAVPAGWALNRQRCGTPEANTVLWLEDGVLTCLASGPSGLSVVEFGAPPRPARWYPRHATPVTIDGARAFRQTGATVRGGKAVVLYFPRRGIAVTVFSPHQALRRRILASVHPVRVNEIGCPTRPHPTFRSGSHPSGPFVPAGAVRVVACSYKGQWLDQSNRVGPAKANRLARGLGETPRGFSHGRRGSILASDCGATWADSLVIAHFEYAGEHRPVAVSAHLDGCSRLGASNGRWAVRLRPGWVGSLIRDAHYAGDYVPYAE